MMMLLLKRMCLFGYCSVGNTERVTGFKSNVALPLVRYTVLFHAETMKKGTRINSRTTVKGMVSCLFLYIVSLCETNHI